MTTELWFAAGAVFGAILTVATLLWLVHRAESQAQAFRQAFVDRGER